MPEHGLKTIFVGGDRRNAGKTLVSCFLLRSLPGAAAVKITCCRTHGGCPRNTPCGVCQALVEPFALIGDHDLLATRGKDTARLMAAATGPVLWLQAKERFLSEGLGAALSRFPANEIVVVEGNAAFRAQRPKVGLLVIGHGDASIRPSVVATLGSVDAVIRNVRGNGSPPTAPRGLPSDVRVFSFDAAHPEDDPEAQAFVGWIRERVGLAAVSQT